jgi:hypothetical protein
MTQTAWVAGIGEDIIVGWGWTRDEAIKRAVEMTYDVFGLGPGCSEHGGWESEEEFLNVLWTEEREVIPYDDPPRHDAYIDGTTINIDIEEV